MAKLRSISTDIWCDPFIEDLTVSEKLLFIYLITNERNNMLGVYEISLKKISFETGIDKATIEKGLERFERVGKVKRVQDYIVLVNFMKNQKYNANMKKSAVSAYHELPDFLKISGLDVDVSNHLKGFETLAKGFGKVRKVEVEVEVEVESEFKENSKELSGEALKLYRLKQREIKFREEVNKTAPDEFPGDEVMRFCDYWTEPNKSKTKLKFELQKTWEISRRLKTWMDRANEYRRNGQPKEITEQLLNMKNPYDD